MQSAPRLPLPPWLKTKLPAGENFERIKGLSAAARLHTVCEEARCPNIAECWGGGTATFMVMGDTCTRGCRFCSVATSARPIGLDPDEPAHLAESISKLGLEYIVVTTVCRDDLEDQGAAHLAGCIREVRLKNPELLLEVLIQDFQGNEDLLRTVSIVPGLNPSGAHVIAHNLETVERLTHPVRDRRAGYRQSLEVLRFIKTIRPDAKTKTSLMVGLGETDEELVQAFRDLRAMDVDIITLGQYLRPTGGGRHLPVAEYIRPENFERLGNIAREMGFLYVASGPFVRSSYRAGELFMRGLLRQTAASH